MSYYDVFVAAVPSDGREAYIAHSEQVRPVFVEHGATEYVECWGSDVPPGDVTSFLLAVKAGEDETVVVGWVGWPSKDVRDAAWPKMMADERMRSATMPFDGKRMIFAGFERIVSV